MTDYELLRELPLAARTIGVAEAQREAWRAANNEQRDLTDEEFWAIALQAAREASKINGLGASPPG